MEEKPGFLGSLVDGIVNFASRIGTGIGDTVTSLVDGVSNLAGGVRDIANIPGAAATAVNATFTVLPFVIIALVAAIIYVFVYRPGNVGVIKKGVIG